MSRKMKDSGVEWIGEIPEEWKVSRMKHEFDMGMGKTILKSDLHEDGQIPVYSATEQDKLFGKIFTAELMLTRGDMVVSARGTIGSVKYITGESTCTQTTIYLKPKRYRSKFQYYYLLGARKHVFPYSDTAVPQLTITDLQAQFMIIPPLSEQQAIADYLDTKVGEIDTNISKLKTASALLSELKQSVIYEAVTGKTFEGKVIDRKMKDSGVEWVGEIPEGWQFKKVKQVLKWTTGFTPDTSNTAAYEGEDYWANISDMGPRYINSTAKTINGKMFPSKHKVPAASLLFSFKLSIGGVSFTGVDMYTNEAICAFSKESAMSLNYAYYATPVYIVKNCKQNIYGADLLNQQLIDNATILVPPLSEQQAIADYLDRKVGEIDNKISIIERKIELLSELKQSVIYEAVTGKIDVRALEISA